MAVLAEITTGFQSGADLAGADIGLYYGIKVTGYMPKGFLTEDGFRPEYAQKYGAIEHTSPEYPPRTEENVKLCQCVVWFGDVNSRGGQLTKRLAKQYRKPFYPIYDRTHPKLLDMFLLEQHCRSLLVAGNRESKSPGIYERTYKFLREALRFQCVQKPLKVREPVVEDTRDPWVMDITMINMSGPIFYPVNKLGKIDRKRIVEADVCPGRLTNIVHDSGVKETQKWISQNPDWVERFSSLPESSQGV